MTTPESNVSERDAKSVAIVGRLIEMKGVHIALEALATDCLNDWTIHIVGDGPMRLQLEEKAADLGLGGRALFHGHVERKKVLEILSAVRCSLLLSTHDAAGWSAAESIAVGTPVVTWSHGGPAELVEQASCGVVVQSQTASVDAVASAILATEPHAVGSLQMFEFDGLIKDIRDWYDCATE
ncbi:glycosyltransferase [Pseudarthrobacter sp. P1]|uniref:glycosyltransferase n=1 Tax=Pseudarthrobacter sp. P1 TaxID=3418418 RepID=UPI003CE7CD98